MATRSRPGATLSPPTLYARCLSALVTRASADGGARHLRALPDTVLLDLYHTMFKENKSLLVDELGDLDIFFRILKANHNRLFILQYFQAVIENDVRLSKRLSSAYVELYQRFKLSRDNAAERDALIQHGIRLGSFLSDAGWYADAEIVLAACIKLCQTAKQNSHYVRLTLECCHRLLHAQSTYRNFRDATETYRLSLKLLEATLDTSHLEAYGLVKPIDGSEILVCRSNNLKEFDLPLYDGEKADSRELNNLIIRLFKEFATFYFLRSNYSETYKWSMKALELLRPDTPKKISIDVLRSCGKACVMMRKIPNAEILMQQAVVRARTYYGQFHPKYAFTLLDYGFYFLNVDSILNSVTLYEEALGIFDQIYSGNNLHLAIAHEDLSYALYVHEYSSGRFYKAEAHINQALKIMESILPSEHLMLATTKRVKALILEEIALDSMPGQNSLALLQESESLHKSALSLSLNAFGEMNVQTAKHYGNLGRLYQSMRRFNEAESMQLRAIDIKKKILGDDDYEVGLSIGHLASLYNYHMNQFTQAEELYYRSISISLKLFGEEYSGLEYDYIGLINVNAELKRPDRVDIYTRLLHRWRDARGFAAERQHPDFGQEIEMPVYELQYEILGNE